MTPRRTEAVSESGSTKDSAAMPTEDAPTEETDVVSVELEEIAQALKGRMKGLTRAVATKYIWLLQDARRRQNMIIQAFRAKVQEYGNRMGSCGHDDEQKRLLLSQDLN